MTTENTQPTVEQTENTTDSRFTEKDVLQQAGTDAHTEVEGEELLKARVTEVINTDTTFVGVTKRVSLELWDAVSNELHAATGLLRTAKTNEDRAKLIEKINSHTHRLGVIADNFLEQ